ncbi:hypothetical protein COO60DRAFT_1532091 [Scenedesmus sp. NREL 46B-D3]|nr:hypothetical protein COO60DRAFT_1532091 [Scenedesmus sp. NREL 46B-D3]
MRSSALHPGMQGSSIRWGRLVWVLPSWWHAVQSCCCCPLNCAAAAAAASMDSVPCAALLCAPACRAAAVPLHKQQLHF